MNPLKVVQDLPPKLKKFVLTFSFLYFIYYFNFFWLIQNVYILNHGIGFTKLSIILAIWSVSIILFEIPSGILADKLGKKPVIIFSKLSFFIGITVFALFPNFWGFILGVITFGIHESFISGAQESLLYDNLKDYGKENLFGKLIALATTFREIGLGSGVLIAGFVTQIGIKYNLIGSIIIAFLGLMTSLLLTEGRNHIKSKEVEYLKHFKESLIIIKNNVNLVRIVLFSITTITAYAVISEYFVPSLNKLGASYILIGLIAAIEAIFFAVGSIISQKISFISKKYLYILLSIFMSFFFLVISIATLPAVLIGFLILRTIKAISEIETVDDWQSHVDGGRRATTISVNSFIKNIVYISFGLLFGKIADIFGLFKGFYLVAALSFSFLILSSFIRTPKNTKILSK
jgi:MFS family permease